MSGSDTEDLESESMRKIFVGGLDAHTTEDHFCDYFGQFGKMVDNVIIKDPVTRLSRRFGFVTYDSSEAVENLLQADSHVIDGKTLDVKKAMPRDVNTENSGYNKSGGGMNESEDTRECEAMRKMFVGGLNRDTTEDTFCDHFGQYGNMVDKVIIKDPQSRVSRGFGFITYDSSDSVESVFQSRPHVIDGKTLDVKRAMPRDYNTTTAHSKVTKLFIGGIGPDLTPEELQSYIENRHPTSIGTVDKIDFLKERETGKNKGFGFLECSDTDFADRLTISENSFTLKGRTMSLKKAEPKPSDGGQGGRGGSRGGRSMSGGGGSRGGGYQSRGGGGGQRGGSRGGGRGGSGGRYNSYDNGFSSQQNGFNDFSTGYPAYGANAGSNTGYGSYNQGSAAVGGGYGLQSNFGSSGGSYGSQVGQGGWSGGGGGGGNRYQPY